MRRLAQVGVLAMMLFAVTAADAKKKRKASGSAADTTITNQVPVVETGQIRRLWSSHTVL